MDEYKLNGRVVARNQNKKKGIWAILAGIGAVLFKFKALILVMLTKAKTLLVTLKFLPAILKFGKTTFSMIFMIWVYTYAYGFAFALGIVLLIFFHEMGHYLTAKKLNIDVSLPLFIPFVGAFISLKEKPEDVVKDATMAIGGPILGSISAGICMLIGIYLDSNFFIALSYVGYILNLFNLLPVYPLDGGRVISAVSPKIWFVGLPIMIVGMFYWFNPILLLVVIMGGYQTYKYIKNKDRTYYEVSNEVKIIFGSLYIIIIGLLVIGAKFSFIQV